jgi:hypothetical protein
MNKEQRAELTDAIDLINQAKEIVVNVAEAESNKYDGLPEGLQGTTQNQKLWDNAAELEGLESDFDTLIQNIQDVIDG